uniref:Putative Erf family protein n=1 Tax=viral metagenome TaxID=1070528 RepID=A0A6M3LDD5_9ZZZZ
MEKSDSISELAKALCIVQGKLEGAKKDSENPFFKSKYADLSSVWEACRKLLSANGLSVVQTNSPSGENTTIIDTTLLHNSGEWISGSLEVPLSKNDPQGLGSAMTYARRYGLSAIVGVCPEDDDAESATQRKQEPPKTEKKPVGRPAKKPVDLTWFRDNLAKLQDSEAWQTPKLTAYMAKKWELEKKDHVSEMMLQMDDKQMAEFKAEILSSVKGLEKNS